MSVSMWYVHFDYRWASCAAVVSLYTVKGHSVSGTNAYQQSVSPTSQKPHSLTELQPITAQQRLTDSLLMDDKVTVGLSGSCWWLISEGVYDRNTCVLSVGVCDCGQMCGKRDGARLQQHEVQCYLRKCDLLLHNQIQSLQEGLCEKNFTFKSVKHRDD